MVSTSQMSSTFCHLCSSTAITGMCSDSARESLADVSIEVVIPPTLLYRQDDTECVCRYDGGEKQNTLCVFFSGPVIIVWPPVYHCQKKRKNMVTPRKSPATRRRPTRTRTPAKKRSPKKTRSPASMARAIEEWMGFPAERSPIHYGVHRFSPGSLRRGVTRGRGRSQRKEHVDLNGVRYQL